MSEVKLARIVTPPGHDFALSRDGSGWVPFRALGLAADDLAAAIAQYERAEAALGRYGGDPVSEPDLACPIVRPSKVIGVGFNYRDHIQEAEAHAVPPDPEKPLIFAKFPSSLTGPFSPIVLDNELTEECDYEVELAVIIGRRARRVSETDALDAVFGYCVANDVSSRDHQFRDGQFSRSKSFDTFCPAGPWVTTADEIADPQRLAIGCRVNSEWRQKSSTSHMVFSVAYLVSYLSKGMTLESGDVLLTGTPSGVGLGMDPPSYLRHGDRVACEIAGLGRIENVVVPPTAEGTGRES